MNDVWRGDHNLPTHSQGTPGHSFGHADFVQMKFAEKMDEHGVLLHRITQVSDLLCAWANYVFQVVHPALSFQFAVQEDVGIRQCLQELLHPCDTRDVGDGKSAVCKWRMFEERRATQDHSLLGQLGRHSSDDLPTPSRSRNRGLVTLARGFHLEGAVFRDRLVAAGIDAPEFGRS